MSTDPVQQDVKRFLLMLAYGAAILTFVVFVALRFGPSERLAMAQGLYGQERWLDSQMILNDPIAAQTCGSTAAAVAIKLFETGPKNVGIITCKDGSHHRVSDPKIPE